MHIINFNKYLPVKIFFFHFQDILKNDALNLNCLSCNLDSSLDVNLSYVNTDFEDDLSVQSVEEATSKISSVENDCAPVKESQLKSYKKQSTYKRYIGEPHKPIKNRTLQDQNRRKKQNKCGIKPLQIKVI